MDRFAWLMMLVLVAVFAPRQAQAQNACYTAPCYEYSLVPPQGGATTEPFLPTKAQACERFRQQADAYNSYWAPHYINGSSETQCSIYTRAGNHYVTRPGYTSRTRSPDACPAGTELQNGQCVQACNPPNTMVDGVCLTPQAQACKLAKDTKTTIWLQAYGRAELDSTTCMENGCQGIWSGPILWVTNRQTGVISSEGEGTYTGATCTYIPQVGNPASSSPDGCKGGFWGEVQGVQTCVPYSGDTNTIESKQKGTTTTTTGGTGIDGTPTTSTTTTGTTTTTTKCDGASCTSTKATETKQGDGSTTTTTTETKVTREAYCATNPADPVCKTSETVGSVTGSCTGGFTCSGDPLQCSIAVATAKSRCLLDAGTGIEATRSALEAGTFGPQLVTVSRDISSFDQVNPFGGSCPGDHQLTLQGFSVVLPLSQACGELQLMGNVLVAFTLLAATIFVVRGFGG